MRVYVDIFPFLFDGSSCATQVTLVDPGEESDDHSTRRGIRSLQAVDGGNSLSDGDEEDAAEPVTGAEDARGME